MRKVLCTVLALVLMLTMSVSAFGAELTAENTTGSMQLTTEIPSEHKITVTYTDGGYVLIGGKLCPSGTEISVDRFGGIDLDVICKKGYHIDKILVNGEDVTAQFADGTLSLDNVVNDIYVEFSFGECAKDPDDDCVKLDMEGAVYLGDKLLSNADMYFDFGSFTAKTDKNGRYYIDDIADGRHVVSISKDGKKLGTCEFVITVTDNVTKVTIIDLPDGTQEVLVPRDTDRIYLNFVIADDNGDGIPDVDPDETDPSIPPEGGFDGTDPDEPKKDDGVDIVIGEPEEAPGPDIPNTFGEFITGPYALIPVMAVSLFLILFMFFKRKKDDEEEEQTA